MLSSLCVCTYNVCVCVCIPLNYKCLRGKFENREDSVVHRIKVLDKEEFSLSPLVILCVQHVYSLLLRYGEHFLLSVVNPDILETISPLTQRQKLLLLVTPGSVGYIKSIYITCGFTKKWFIYRPMIARFSTLYLE